MKQFVSVKPAGLVLLGITAFVLPLAAQVASKPTSDPETASAQIPSPSTAQSGTAVPNTQNEGPDQAQQSAPAKPPVDAQAPAAPAAEGSDDTTKTKPQPGQSAKEAVLESTQGNGGRVFGVLPNYRTTNIRDTYKPLRVKDKWLIAAHDVFDPTNFAIAGIFAGFHQASDAHPQFGQGVEGYSKYYVTAFMDQGIGNIMTEGVFATLFHEDPRYFRIGTGSVHSRIGHAMKQIIITRTDSGGTRFNTSEFVGSAVATGLQNVYYDDQNARQNVLNWGAAIGTDMFSDILKEFWPDIKHHMGKN
jgi:hypothetical protein